MLTRKLATLVIVAAAIMLSGCGYNDIQRADEAVKAGWSEVINQYQRRADLIPNLINTVKGFAQQEQDVLTKVTEARARATGISELIGTALIFGAVPEAEADSDWERFQSILEEFRGIAQTTDTTSRHNRRA